jgi:hypothetical protein
MSQAAAIRRRSQAKKSFRHLAPQQRPLYRRKALGSIHAAIERERIFAARQVASKKK